MGEGEVLRIINIQFQEWFSSFRIHNLRLYLGQSRYSNIDSVPIWIFLWIQ